MNLPDVPSPSSMQSDCLAPSVPLASAVLCVDCEQITIAAHDACALCGSHALLSVTQVFGGVLDQDRARLLERNGLARCA